MTSSNQPKAAMQDSKSSTKPGAPQGARRATEGAPSLAAPAVTSDDGCEVVAHARRRQFSNADKRRILEAVDRCTKPGEIGAIMRSEGVYSSSLSTWRHQREAADLAALAAHRLRPWTTRRCAAGVAHRRGLRPHAHSLRPVK